MGGGTFLNACPVAPFFFFFPARLNLLPYPHSIPLFHAPPSLPTYSEWTVSKMDKTSLALYSIVSAFYNAEHGIVEGLQFLPFLLDTCLSGMGS